jgi:hypothetical protein
MTTTKKGIPGSEGTRFSKSNQPTRRRGPSLTMALKRQLREVNPETGRRMIEDLAHAIIAAAGRGSGTAIREIWNRLDGVPSLKIEGLETPRPIINFISSVPDEDDSLQERPLHPMQKHHEGIDAALLEAEDTKEEDDEVRTSTD